MEITSEEIDKALEVALQRGRERVKTGALVAEADYLCGAMAIMEGLGLWGRIPPAWSIYLMSQRSMLVDGEELIGPGSAKRNHPRERPPIEKCEYRCKPCRRTFTAMTPGAARLSTGRAICCSQCGEVAHFVRHLTAEEALDWPDRDDYNYRNGIHELRIFRRNLRKIEHDAYRQQAQIALLYEQDALFLCYRFGGLPWADCSFSPWLVPEEDRELPSQQEEQGNRALMNVIVVEGTTGIITRLRTFTLSPDVTRVLHQAIEEMAAKPFPGVDKYTEIIRRTYERYPQTVDMVRAATVRCVGGE